MSAPVEVRLDDAEGPTVLGMRVRERNRRVAMHAGAIVGTDASASDRPGAEARATLEVPSHVVIEAALFDHLPAPGTSAWLTSPAQAARLPWEAPGDDAPERPLPEGVFYDVADPSVVGSVERALLRHTQKPTDGVVSRHINRPQSRLFSRAFLRLGLGPNHASCVSACIGLASGWFAAQPGWFGVALAGVFFQLASMFDGVDGEMARVTVRQSALGAKIDTAVDNGTYLVCLVGFAVGWVREGVGPAQLALAIVMVVGVVVVLLQALVFVRRYAPDASFVFVDTCVRRAARTSSAPTLRAAGWFFYLFRRDVLALALMLVALTGSRAAIVGLVLAGLLAASFTLLVHRRALVRAALEETSPVP